ncbi:MAG: hypothetical protein ACTHJ1_00860 [Bordetella sp.]|uniref:hypothetical protein n=1 Tax=Bordetella sp. TaxID=28081 RepID=UPI003F7B4D38
MSIAASAVLPSLPSLPISGLRRPASAAPSSGKSRACAPARQQPAAQVPRKWPFPPEPQSSGAQAIAFQSAASLGDVRQMSANQIVSRKAMLLDVLMVAAWGIAIPAVLWLGSAAGF